MKFHVRIIQFDILLVLNKYTFKIHQFLVKSKTEFLQWLKEYITVIILWQLRISNFFNLSRLL